MTTYSARILREAEKALESFLDLCLDLETLSKSDAEKIEFYTSLFERGMSREDKKERREKLIVHLDLFEKLYNEMRPQIYKIDKNEDLEWISKGDFSLAYISKGSPVEKSRINISKIFNENEEAQEEFVYTLFRIFACLNLEEDDSETVDLIIANYKPKRKEPESENAFVEVAEKLTETISDEKTMGALKTSFGKLMENDMIARLFNQAKMTDMGQQVMGVIQQVTTAPPEGQPVPSLPPTPSQ